ncbi:MAG: RNA degradosome polyphosphate kinase, partial [Pseudomonadota bacterium]|nr:RNA degradosome polyphosphate kinase [Pseudomonadota bacterium]
AVIELRARFDEEANIDLATQLQDAGANVVYGIVGYKTHAKMLLVVRREGGRLRRDAHLGTGNYHTGTARLYTDFSFMTSRKDVTADVHRLFTQLTGLGQAERLDALLQAPFTLRDGMLNLIEAEAKAARNDKPARVILKVNSISDPVLIKALYRASQAGVQVDLIVRGICCLRPGVPGISDNITVRSVVGRLLEHTRIYYFLAGGDEKVFLASADWMIRNLYHRVETCFPIVDDDHKQRVITEGLFTYLSHDRGAWMGASDAEYYPITNTETAHISPQDALIEKLAEA